MALTITVNDDLTSSTLRTESDGREALLELSEFNDSQEKFADKAAVEAYVNAVAGDDPRWAWKSLIGIVNSLSQLPPSKRTAALSSVIL